MTNAQPELSAEEALQLAADVSVPLAKRVHFAAMAHQREGYRRADLSSVELGRILGSNGDSVSGSTRRKAVRAAVVLGYLSTGSNESCLFLAPPEGASRASLERDASDPAAYVGRRLFAHAVVRADSNGIAEFEPGELVQLLRREDGSSHGTASIARSIAFLVSVGLLEQGSGLDCLLLPGVPGAPLTGAPTVA